MPQGSDTFLTQGSWVSVVTFAWPICFLVLAILPQPTFFFFLFYLIAFHILFKVTLTLYGARLNICIHTYVLGWPRSQYGFFHKIDTFFDFTNNFIDIDISSMSAISQVVEHWFFSINVSIWSLPTSTALRDCGTSSSQNLQHKTSQITFDTLDQSQHLLYTLHKSFFCVYVVFLPSLK